MAFLPLVNHENRKCLIAKNFKGVPPPDVILLELGWERSGIACDSGQDENRWKRPPHPFEL